MEWKGKKGSIQIKHAIARTGTLPGLSLCFIPPSLWVYTSASSVYCRKKERQQEEIENQSYRCKNGPTDIRETEERERHTDGETDTHRDKQMSTQA
mmetsp:Transcript_16954/g.34405  ORF Transcript_16954/g.34405 Transcript_16954/m.34405 type:complete len:96 (+) Transcript_16954:202-489(+)